MKNHIEKLPLLCVIIAVFSTGALSFGGPPIMQPTFYEKSVWNVRWQFQPDSPLLFDAIDTETPYYERLRNSTVTGISNTTLHPSIEFLNSPRHIAFRLNVNGVSRTPTRSMTQIAAIYSDSELAFRSTMNYTFRSDVSGIGYDWYRSGASVSGSLINRNIRIQLNRGCLPNIKKHLIMTGFGQSAEILRSRGLGKLQKQVHAEMTENLNDLISTLNGKHASDAEQSTQTTHFHCHSDKRGAYGTLRFGTMCDKIKEFPDVADEIFKRYPVALAFEQSTFEQAMQARLGGRTIPLDRLPEYMFVGPWDNDSPADATNPENMTVDAASQDDGVSPDTEEIRDDSCYALLNSEKPLELIVSGGNVTLIIHADQFEQGQKSYPGMNIEMTYRRVASGDIPENMSSDEVAVPLLVLDGAVRINPKDENGESRRSLRTVTIRRWLLNFFERDLPKQVTRDSLVYADENGTPVRVGQFHLAADSFALEDGWFAVGCRLIPESPSYD